MKKIFVCSPYRDNNTIRHIRNLQLAKDYCKDLVDGGYMPLAPHLYFTYIYDDNVKEERELGIKMGIEWLKECDEIHVIGNKITDGMKQEIKVAKELGKEIIFRNVITTVLREEKEND